MQLQKERVELDSFYQTGEGFPLPRLNGINAIFASVQRIKDESFNQSAKVHNFRHVGVVVYMTVSITYIPVI